MLSCATWYSNELNPNEPYIHNVITCNSSPVELFLLSNTRQANVFLSWFTSQKGMQLSVLEIKKENYDLRSNYFFRNSLNHREYLKCPKTCKSNSVRTRNKGSSSISMEYIPISERKMKLNIFLWTEMCAGGFYFQ